LAGLAGLAAGAPAAVSWLAAGLAIPVIYLVGVTAVSGLLSQGVPSSARARLPLVLAVMHMCWGAGFLTSPRGLHRPMEGGTQARSDSNEAERPRRASEAGAPGRHG
jgi:hypothetical protein